MNLTLKYFLFVLFLPAVVSAQFRFEHLTVNEGLAHSDAMAVAQDKNGFVWIGTNKGIDRYDGYVIKNYPLPNPTQSVLYSNRILSHHIGIDSTFWVVPEALGVYFYDETTDQFINLADRAPDKKDRELIRSLMVRSITTSPDGRLFLGTSTQGVYIIELQKGHKVKHIQHISFVEKGDNPLIFSLKAETNNRIWVGTVGKGIYWLEKTSEQHYQTRAFNHWDAKIIRGMWLDASQNMWVVSENQLAVFKPINGYQPQTLNKELPNATYLYQDSYQRFWIGTRNGLFLVSQIQEQVNTLTAQVNHFIPDPSQAHSLNYHLIHQITEDQFKNLWIAASAGGLNKVNLSPKAFKNINKSQNRLPNNYVNTICTDPYENAIWIGTRNGFTKYNLSTHQSQTYLEVKNLLASANTDVSYLYNDPKGHLWICTRTHGVYLLNKKTQQIKRLNDVPGFKEWKYAEPIAVSSDDAGNIWVACFYDGIHIYDAEGNYQVSFDKKNSHLPSAKLTYLLNNREGGVWLSTRDAGILKLKLQNKQLVLQKQIQFDPKGLKTNYIWPLTYSQNGSIWVGTIGGGLHRLNPKTYQVERFDKWFPETDVESILEDREGNLWMGGSGLFKFNPNDKSTLHFNVGDGLQSNSFKVGSAAMDASGNLYFGGINGVSYFNPQAVSTNPYPPKMQITQVRILTYSLSEDGLAHPRAALSGTQHKTIEIKASENDFSIEFVGLNYINPQKQHYEYKLDGYHTDWIALPQGQRMTTFSGLPAGKYTFMVRSDNGDGVWSNTPATLQITILPPWYQTWWAYTLYLLAIGGLMAWYSISKNKERELKNKIALEQVEKQKHKELADLKLDFFTNISHELRTPLTLIMSPAADLVQSVEGNEEAQQKAKLVHKQASKLLDLVNQLMDFRKVESGTFTLQPQTIDLVPFLFEIYQLFRIKAEEQNVEFTFNLALEKLNIQVDPDKLEIIITNLLSNAFKFTLPGGKIKLSVQFIGNVNEATLRKDHRIALNYISLKVMDSGSGIPPEDIPYIFEPFFQAKKTKSFGTGIGLSLVKELAEKHKGEVKVESTLGMGSTFEIKLPYEPNLLLDEKESQTLNPWPLETLDTFKEDYHILIVEDNNDLRNYLVQLLGPYLNVTAAENGNVAWKIMEKQLPDIILSDVMMPEMDGLQLSEKVKTHPKYAHIPIVLLTARAALIHELEGLEKGADDYITKPFNPKLLVSKVLGILNNRKKVQEYFHKKIMVEPSQAVIPDADKAFIETSMRIIEDNLANTDFNVQTLVKESGMSQSAYYRKLKHITGQSVIEFIKDIRLKRAAQLLASGNYRVSEVALMVGMEDLKNFRASFQKLYGMSPSEYLKK